MLYNMRLPIILVYPTGEADQNAQNAVRKHVKGVKTLLENYFVLDIEIMSDEEALKSDLTNKNIIVYGTVEGNLFLRRYSDGFPFSVRDDGITLDREYAGDSLRLITGLPSPVNPENGIVIYTAQKAEDIPDINSIFHGPTDYVVARGAEILGSGDYGNKEGAIWSFD